MLIWLEDFLLDFYKYLLYPRSRRDIKLNFDFAGRKVVEDETVPEYIIHEDKQMMQLFKGRHQLRK